jgi:hypothetical protein
LTDSDFTDQNMPMISNEVVQTGSGFKMKVELKNRMMTTSLYLEGALQLRRPVLSTCRTNQNTSQE